jgi:hypothetical protein
MTEAPASARVAEYLNLAERMRTAAERAFDPEIASAYLALSAKWVRLAEQAQQGVRTIDRTKPVPDKRDNGH